MSQEPRDDVVLVGATVISVGYCCVQLKDNRKKNTLQDAERRAQRIG
jgi:hypothetical protein